jgi:hypothetical protein
MLDKSTITGIVYALMIPLGTWAGYLLGQENYIAAIPIIIASMVLEFMCVKFWIAAQTESIIGKETRGQ